MPLNFANPDWAFLLFLGGMVYVFLAFAGLLLRPRDPEAPAWDSLVLFGVLMGLSIWTEMVARTLEPGPWADLLRLGLLAGAQGAQLAFAARSLHRLGWGPRSLRWAPLALAGLVGLLAALAPGRLDSLIRFLLGIPAGLGTGLVLLLATRQQRTGGRDLRWAGCLLALAPIPSALSTLMPGGISTPNHVAIPLLRLGSALLVTGAAFSLWWAGEPLRPRRVRDHALLALVFLVLAGGWVLVRRVEDASRRAFHAQLLDVARFTAGTLPPGSIDGLAGLPSDRSRPEYQALRRHLGLAQQAWPRLRFLYILVRREDRVVFLADSEPESSPDHSPPGSPYPEASPVLKEALDSGLPLTEGPLADRFGTWISAFAPLRSPEGRTLGILGLDVEADVYARMVGRARMAPIFGVMLIGLLLLAMDLGLRLERERRTLSSRAHRERRDILEALDIQVWCLKAPDTYSLVNQAFAAYHGWFAEELADAPLDRVLSGEALAGALEGNRKAFQDGLSQRYEQWDLDALGRRRFLAISLVPRLDEHRRVVAVVGSAVDLTARKVAEAARLDLERRLAEARRSESLSRMAGAVAHHFNNLLGAALGSLELAEVDLDPGSRVRSRIARAREATRKAADLSLQMLTYLGRDAEVARQELHLPQALEPLLEELRSRMPQEIVLASEVPEGLPALEVDPEHLTALVTHLVLNAAEALGEDAGRILVRVGRVRPGALLPGHRIPSDWTVPQGGATVLEVADNGPGIAPEWLDHLFEPFFTTRFQGRGLGLASVLGIARTYGGAVSVETAPGQGATFRVFLP